ncbi:MAG: hypothetical protein H7331_05630 [Bacteroidia bacterium]|nr:hypothetical protein [Bacteroidia bacterium]
MKIILKRTRTIVNIALSIIYTTAWLMSGIDAQAQNIGINTLTPDASAILDIKHTTRGLLIPRLQLVASNNPTPITAPALSLLVFNLLPAGVFPNEVKTGYYYWDGAKWVGIGASNAWDLLGNANTTAGTNFIGTTDNQDLVFKRNGVQCGLINASLFNTSFGVSSLGIANTGTSNVAIGAFTLNMNTSGLANTAIGLSALYANTTGSFNSANGYSALQSNTLGYNNTAFGYATLANNVTGNNNTAIGYNALETSVSGMQNVALGYQIGLTNITGSNLLLLGALADVTVDGLTNATAIGYNSHVGASNSLILGGTFVDAVNVGIGTTTPLSLLHIQQPTTTPLTTTGNYGINEQSAGIRIKNEAVILGTNVAQTGLLFEGPDNGAITAYQAIMGGTNGLDYLDFYTSGRRATLSTAIPKMRINPIGNVGIGTTTPALKLHLHDATQNFHALRLTSGISQANYWDLVKRGDAYGVGQNHNFVFAYNNVEQVTIATSGNMGIGVGVPTEKLDIAGSIKIVDGTQGLNKVLTSDATGKATWQAPAGAVLFTYNITPHSNVANGGTYVLPGFSYTVTKAGNYRIEFRCWNSFVAATPGMAVAEHIRLLQNGVPTDQYEAYCIIGSNTPTTTFTTFLHVTGCSVGDVLTIDFRGGIAAGATTIDFNNLTPWTTSKVLIYPE